MPFIRAETTSADKATERIRSWSGGIATSSKRQTGSRLLEYSEEDGVAWTPARSSARVRRRGEGIELFGMREALNQYEEKGGGEHEDKRHAIRPQRRRPPKRKLASSKTEEETYVSPRIGPTDMSWRKR